MLLRAMSSFVIRDGLLPDLPRVLELIQELALYERAPDEVTNTLELMERDGFGERPTFQFAVVEDHNKQIVGTAIWYVRYSTWKGNMLYLEDIIVTESCRRKGAGSLLFEYCIRTCKTHGFAGMTWQVLEWNEPAIQFYKKYNAILDPEWVNGKITKEMLSSWE
ncbi:MAG: N-acetyltransferase family protein [Flavobacteriales bacterium]